MASISTINGYTIDAGKFYGIDTSRILFSGPLDNGQVYIAPEDCYCFFNTTHTTAAAYISIDNVKITISGNYGSSISRFIFLKQGQTFLFANVYTHNFKVYGVK